MRHLGTWKKVFISYFFPKSTKAPSKDAYYSSDDLDEGIVKLEKAGGWDSWSNSAIYGCIPEGSKWGTSCMG